MFLFGIGFKNTNHKSSLKKKKVMEFIIDETLLKVSNGYVYGYG
jgi:hypothetical protein